MEFTGLGAEMAQLAGRFGSIDPRAAGRDGLEQGLRTGRRLRGMIDAREALMTCQLEALLRQGVPEPAPDDDGAGAAADSAGGAAEAKGR